MHHGREETGKTCQKDVTEKQYLYLCPYLIIARPQKKTYDNIETFHERNAHKHAGEIAWRLQESRVTYRSSKKLEVREVATSCEPK